MKCNQICEWNGWGHDVSCFRPANEKCPMVMTVEEFDQQAKADGGKLQIHMVPMQIVRDIAEVRMYGTKKYGDENNWRKVELMRYVDALLRHTLALRRISTAWTRRAASSITNTWNATWRLSVS